MEASKTLNHYLPTLVEKLWPEIERATEKGICLVGYSESYKWICRLLKENQKEFFIFDHRKKYIGYTLGEDVVSGIEGIEKIQNPVIVICEDNVVETKKIIRICAEKPSLCAIPVIFNSSDICRPITNEEPFINIYTRSTRRARSVNSDERLFNLLQCVRETLFVEGSILEVGSFAGGTGSIILETLLHYKVSKDIWLCDSYSGLPKTALGVDYRWNDQFSNVSESEVREAFKDYKNVNIVSGNIFHTVPQIDGPFSFVHFDSDTYESARALVPLIWEKITLNGILLFDDVGFYPNCLPISAFVEQWVETLQNAFRFHLPSQGFIIVKK